MVGAEVLEKLKDGIVEMPLDAELLTKESVDVEFGYAKEELSGGGRISEELVLR